MNVHFLNYQVNQNHNFLFSTQAQYTAFINKHKLYTQTVNNTAISEGTTEINLNFSDSKIKNPFLVGYIIVENDGLYLNFIVTNFKQISAQVVTYTVQPDIFRNDLNGDANFSVDITAQIDQTNAPVGAVLSSQIIPYDVGDPIRIENETYPLINADGTNWVVVICGETTFGNYSVLATDYASDIGSMTAIARVLTQGTEITRVDDVTKKSTYKPTSCYIIPKTIIRDGYSVSTAYTINTEKAVKLYAINAYFKRTEIIKPKTSPLHIYDFGTIAKRVRINKQFSDSIYVLAAFNSSDISIGIQYNNIFLDVTDEFEFPILTDEFAQFATLNKKSLAVKGVSAVASIGAGIISKNPIAVVGGLMQAGSTVSAYLDKADEPYTITGNNNGCANVTFNNGFSFRTYAGRNYTEAARVTTLFGNKYQNIEKNLSELLNAENRAIGKTFIKFKFINTPEKIRPETFAKLLNGVFV